MSLPLPPLLFVDDEKNMRVSLKTVLTDERYSVRTVESAEEALELLAREDFFMVITDARLGGMSGYELLGKARTQWPELPVLLCGCSPGAFGGARAQLAWRATLANMGALALPASVTVPGADQNLDASGAPTDPRTQKSLRSALDSFLSLAARVRNPAL